VSEVVFASSLANPKIRTLLKPYIKEINWKSKTAQELVDFMEERVDPGHLPKLGEIRSYMSKNGHLMEEIEQVLKSVKDFIVMPVDSIDGFLEDFNKFYCNKRLNTVFEQRNDLDPVKIVDSIKEIPKVKGESLPLVSLGNCDVQKVIEEEIGDIEVMPSRFDFVRRATPWGGYLRGQLLMVTAPPGVGKSTFILNEAINFLKSGYKVYWIALGDMMSFDFITRSTSIIKGLPFSTVANNINEYFDDEVREITKNLRLTVLPADTVSMAEVSEFVETVVSVDENPDVVILDYDANLRSHNPDNMFIQGRQVYNAMAKITRPKNFNYRLGIIASQPKIQFWGLPELPKECASESSGKQAVVDFMITIGRDYRIRGKHAGIMSAAKVRRGKEGVKSYYILNDYGHFQEIEHSEYLLLRTHEG